MRTIVMAIGVSAVVLATTAASAAPGWGADARAGCSTWPRCDTTPHHRHPGHHDGYGWVAYTPLRDADQG